MRYNKRSADQRRNLREAFLAKRIAECAECFKRGEDVPGLRKVVENGVFSYFNDAGELVAAYNGGDAPVSFDSFRGDGVVFD